MFLSDEEEASVRHSAYLLSRRLNEHAPSYEKLLSGAMQAKLSQGINQLRDLKRLHPEIKSGVNKGQVGSILNAYREGDLTFDECCQLLEAKQKESCIEF